jgi:hypothetical protein
MAVVETTSLAQPERSLQRALRDGLAYYALPENIGKIDDMFAGQDADEIAQIKEFVTEWGNKNRIVIGYPRSHSSFPCIAIVLRGENESVTMLADLLKADGPEGQAWVGIYYGANFGLGIFTQNGDLTIDLYRLVKHVLLTKKQWLERHNIHNMIIHGSDIEPTPEYLPEYVFLRYCEVEAIYLEAVLLPLDEVKGRVASFEAKVFNGNDDKRNVETMDDGGNIKVSLAEFTVETEE